MRNSFQNLQKGDRVLVLPSNYLDFKESRRQRKNAAATEKKEPVAVKSVQVSSIAALANELRGTIFDEDSPRFPGLISRVR